MKLVVDGTTDRVVGCHIVGPDAAEMIQIVGIAVKMGATKADFDATMARASDRRRGAGDHARRRPRATSAKRRNSAVRAVAGALDTGHPAGAIGARRCRV